MNAGFILAHKTGKRRLVDAAAAFDAYCRCDSRCQLDAESYLSAFSFGDDFARHLTECGSTKNFNGACWARWLSFDIDRTGDLVAALADSQKLCRHLIGLGCPADCLLIFFSGSKGFHVGLPTSLWLPEPSPMFHSQCRSMAEGIANEVGIGIDVSVYTKVQPFRSPNSRHPKTGLYKRRLTFAQLAELGILQIQEMAKQPEAFAYLLPRDTSDKLRALWLAAGDAIKTTTPPKQDGAEQVGNGHCCRAAAAMTHPKRQRLNQLTMEFIRQGAGEGDRHRMLFSAAANLAEFSCPCELAYALLMDAALDCGLSPQDAKRQIDCGWAKGAANE